MKMRLRPALITLAAFAGFALTPFEAPLCAPAPTTAIIETSMGTIEVRLDSTRAPVTVKNFTDYAESGFYDGTIFHRVIEGFMIQGGGFTSDMTQKRPRLRLSTRPAGPNRIAAEPLPWPARASPIRLRANFSLTQAITIFWMRIKAGTAGDTPSSDA